MTDRGRGTRSILLGIAALLALGGAAAAQTTPDTPKKRVVREDNWPKKIRFGESTVSLDAPQAESLDSPLQAVTPETLSCCDGHGVDGHYLPGRRLETSATAGFSWT